MKKDQKEVPAKGGGMDNQTASPRPGTNQSTINQSNQSTSNQQAINPAITNKQPFNFALTATEVSIPQKIVGLSTQKNNLNVHLSHISNNMNQINKATTQAQPI